MMETEGNTINAVETPSSHISPEEGIRLIYDGMANFLPDPSGNILKDMEYIRDTAKGLINLCNLVSQSSPDLRKEIEDFSLFVRDPVGYQQAINEEIRREREEREKEKENLRLMKIAEKEALRIRSKRGKPVEIPEGVPVSKDVVDVTERLNRAMKSFGVDSGSMRTFQ